MDENNVSAAVPETEAAQDALTVLTVEQDGDTLVIKAPADVKIELVQESTEAEKEPAAEKAPWETFLTFGIVGALVIAIMVMVIRKLTAKKKPAPAPVVVEEAAPAVAAPVAPGAAGEVKLHNVDPKTAAMLMAIVADKMQKPINELRFISIKEVE